MDTAIGRDDVGVVPGERDFGGIGPGDGPGRRDSAMGAHDGGIEDLFERAGTGDRSAIGRLLERHRGRLRSCVARRIDRRTAARFDLSDVVQETLIDAGRRLPEYLRDRPVGFFPWLNQLARQRLVDLRRTHLGSQKRSVIREQAREPGVNSTTSPPTTPARAVARSATRNTDGFERSSIDWRRGIGRSSTSDTARICPFMRSPSDSRSASARSRCAICARSSDSTKPSIARRWSSRG